MISPRSDHDVVIVGGGPAGAAAALGMGRRGLRVLLLDRKRFPRSKVCGDAITPMGVAMLDELGLLGAVTAAADARVSDLVFGFGTSQRRVSLPTPLLVVRRETLDALLLDAARTHVEVREGWRVDRLHFEGDAVCGVAGTTSAGSTFVARATVVIGADGASSTVARLATRRTTGDRRRILATRAYYADVAMPEPALEFHFLPELDGGYLWVFPAGDGCHNVGLGMTDEKLRKSGRTLRQWRDACLSSPTLAHRLAAARPITAFEGGQIPFAGTNQPISGAGFVLVGDAAELGDAFWGDGIDTALVSGALAAVHVATAVGAGDVSGRRLAAYDRGVARVLGRKLGAGLALQRAAARDPAAVEASLFAT